MRVISDELRMAMTGSTHSNDDTLILLGPAISDSSTMTDSISKTIRESVRQSEKVLIFEVLTPMSLWKPVHLLMDV